MLKQIKYILLISFMAYCYGCQSPRYVSSLEDFPEYPQDKLQQYQKQISTDGGVVIAGRVKLGDGIQIQNGSDIQVNLDCHGDRPSRVYKNGLFFIDRILPKKFAGSNRHFLLRAFGYEPIDDLVTLVDGDVTYLNYTMKKVPPNRLGGISGFILNERGQPFAGATVRLSYPYANYGSLSTPSMSVKTKSDGRFQFKGLENTEFSITVSAPEYAYHNVHFHAEPGQTIEQNFKLYAHKSITLNYVYQADGHTDFTSGDLHRGQLKWTDNQGGVDFSDGKVEQYEPESLRDLELRLDQGQLKFRNFYVNGRNGFYNAGELDLDKVTQAKENGYSTRLASCQLGHVYIVRTYEGHYAKFKVIDIE